MPRNRGDRNFGNVLIQAVFLFFFVKASLRHGGRTRGGCRLLLTTGHLSIRAGIGEVWGGGSRCSLPTSSTYAALGCLKKSFMVDWYGQQEL